MTTALSGPAPVTHLARTERAFLGAWAVYWATNSIIWYAAYRPNLTLAYAFGTFLYLTASWAIAAILITRWMRAWAPRTRLSRRMALQLCAALAAAVVLPAALRTVVATLAGTTPHSSTHYFVNMLARWGDFHIATFAAVALAARAWAHFTTLREVYDDSRVAAEELDDIRRLQLQRQLRPHFVFNVLTAVGEQVPQHPGPADAQQVAAADVTLGHLEQLLTDAERAEHQELISVEDELATLQHYLALQRVRFGERLTFHVDCEPSIQHLLIPVFLLQPLVENAVQHGVATHSGSARVAILLGRENGILVIRVIDNGPGINRSTKARGHGLGLSITRARLNLIFGDSASLTLVNAMPVGAEASIRVPISDGSQRAAVRGGAAALVERGEEQEVEQDAARRIAPIARQMQVVWGLWGIAHLLGCIGIDLTSLPLDTWTVSGRRLGDYPDTGYLPQMLGVAMWLIGAPFIVRLAWALQERIGTRSIPVVILAHAPIAVSIGYLSMRLPLTLAGFSSVTVFEPGPFNTVAQSILLYSVAVFRIELDRTGTRIRSVMRARDAVRGELAAARRHGEHSSLPAAILLPETQALRLTLARDPATFAADLQVMVRRLRTCLDNAAEA